jgi:dolichyl-phosphate mannosyltransferase polypeptide 2 regulatory subunit
MEMGDKAVGLVLTMTSLSIFTYYTFWVIILVSKLWALHVLFLINIFALMY